jgi:hypothetical protein
MAPLFVVAVQRGLTVDPVFKKATMDDARGSVSAESAWARERCE